MNSKLNQRGQGIGEDAYNFFQQNSGKIADLLIQNRAKVFQGTANAQRYVSKNILNNPRPIRYLKEGEIHVPNHNFTGPGTRVDLPDVRNHAPYNNIDACSKVHDIEFNEIFKMPAGPERQQMIRNADLKVIDCYKKYPNEPGYALAKNGINSKMALEDLSPTVFNAIMGESYRGAQHGLKVRTPRPPKNPKPSKQAKPRQTGGLVDPVTGGLIVAAVPVGIAMYGEYRLGKLMYDKLRNQSNRK
jgi:hypothetical protein